MKITQFASILFLCFIFLFCHSSAYSQNNEAIQPTIMIFPSDGLMDRLGYVKRIDIDGRKRTVQDYEQLLIDEPELRFAISEIQGRFSDLGFPLKDLEYTLKSINTEEAFDAANQTDIDLKGVLLKAAQPDIYLDLDYFYSGSGLQKSLTFSIRAIDAYTKLSVATAGDKGVQGIESNEAKLLEAQVEKNIQNLVSTMRQHFTDIRQNGRIIHLKIAMEKGSPINDFRRERCNGLPYHRLFRDYIKRNTKNSAFVVGTTSGKEITYDQIRIPLFDDEGFPIDASDWSFKFTEYLFKTCNLNAIDNSSKLGDAYILILSE